MEWANQPAMDRKMDLGGIAPPASPMRTERSAAELQALVVSDWSDLNEVQTKLQALPCGALNGPPFNPSYKPIRKSIFLDMANS